MIYISYHRPVPLSDMTVEHDVRLLIYFEGIDSVLLRVLQIDLPTPDCTI